MSATTEDLAKELEAWAKMCSPSDRRTLRAAAARLRELSERWPRERVRAAIKAAFIEGRTIPEPIDLAWEDSTCRKAFDYHTKETHSEP